MFLFVLFRPFSVFLSKKIFLILVFIFVVCDLIDGSVGCMCCNLTTKNTDMESGGAQTLAFLLNTLKCVYLC